VQYVLIIPAKKASEIRRIMVQGHPDKKVHKSNLNEKKAGHGGVHLTS
jgi:hypothetical protein